MASNEDARAAREAKLDELHEKLTGAVESLVSGDDWREALAFAARFRSRSFNNTMLIWVQHEAAFEAGRVPEPFPTLVAGYRQWQGLGRQVLKGQPGYMIFAPVTGRFASSNPSDPESWRRLDRFEKPKPGEMVSILSHRRRVSRFASRTGVAMPTRTAWVRLSTRWQMRSSRRAPRPPASRRSQSWVTSLPM